MGQHEPFGAVTQAVHVWPCPERRGTAVRCFHMEIEGQSPLLDNLDQGLMKNYELRRFQKNKTIGANVFFFFFFFLIDGTKTS